MRPKSIKKIVHSPAVTYFKPQGVPLRTLDIVCLTLEECEAIRLKNVLGYDQETCAQHMCTSQSTVQRLLTSAYTKIADALVHGKAIRIMLNEETPKSQESTK